MAQIQPFWLCFEGFSSGTNQKTLCKMVITSSEKFNHANFNKRKRKDRIFSKRKA